LLFVFKISRTCEAIKMPLQEVEKEATMMEERTKNRKIAKKAS